MVSQLAQSARSNLFRLGSLRFLEGDYTFLHSKARIFFLKLALEVWRLNVWIKKIISISLTRLNVRHKSVNWTRDRSYNAHFNRPACRFTASEFFWWWDAKCDLYETQRRILIGSKVRTVSTWYQSNLIKCEVRPIMQTKQSDRSMNQSQLIKWNCKLPAPICFLWATLTSLKETIRSNTPKLGVSYPEAHLRFEDEMLEAYNFNKLTRLMLGTSPWTAPTDRSYNAHLNHLSIH